LIEVTLYSRANCDLCKEAESLLQELQNKIQHNLTIVDIDRDPVMVEMYGKRIPVVEVGPFHLDAPFDHQQLLVTLGAAKDRLRTTGEEKDATQLPISRSIEAMTTADKISLWITKHYMLLFNLFILFYVGLPFLAPVLVKAGATVSASLIYRGYSFMCHQLAFRSWFLFGEQAIYPRQAAGLNGILSYENATGIRTDDLIAAHNFIGNDELGYKVALCERDIAIYGGIFLFGLIFSLTGRRFPLLPWWAWIFIGVAPIGADGGSQLISQLPVGFINHIIPYRESTPLLRTLTGGLFGIMTAWFAYPLVEFSMRDTQIMLAVKFSKAMERKPVIHS